MNKKIFKISASALILFFIGYFYVLEFKQNWEALQHYAFTPTTHYLAFSLVLFIISYLVETYAWRVCINKHLAYHKLSFSESLSIVNASGLLRYVPGKVWMYAAQMRWLKKYSISKSKILHANIICVIGSMTISAYLGILFLLLYTPNDNKNIIMVILFVTLTSNLIYLVCNSVVLNTVVTIVNRYLKLEVQHFNNSIPLLIYIQFLYACSWFLAGVAGYYLAAGVGLHLGPRQVLALLASMALSWLAGQLAVITPSGLGVREGFMMLMLNNIVSVHTALLFPILSRIMLLVAEALLGALALVLGMKLRVFAPPPADPPLQQNLDPLDQPLETPK